MHFPVNILELDRLASHKMVIDSIVFASILPIEFVPMLKLETVKKKLFAKKKNEIVKLYLNFLYATTQKMNNNNKIINKQIMYSITN